MDGTTYSFYERFVDDNFCLLYDGNIVDEVTDKIIGISEINFEHQEDYSQSKKKVSFLLAECFQNIIRHSDKSNNGNIQNSDFGFFLTRNLHGIYFITSGNLIRKENVSALKQQLNQINSLDPENLKALYLEVLANKGFSQKGGAGLGLIEIARKSGQKIEFVFDDFDDEFSVFYSQVMIKPPKQFAEHAGYHIVEAMQFHRTMVAQNIIMMQKGDFSNSSIFPVMEIFQKNLPELFHQTHPRREVYHVLVEMLQNIVRNGIEKDGRKEGIFLIRRNEHVFTISTGSFVNETQKNSLDRQIVSLNRLSKKEIKDKYLQSLNNDNQNDQLELIDIARRAAENLQSDFKQIATELYFFTLSVTV